MNYYATVGCNDDTIKYRHCIEYRMFGRTLNSCHSTLTGKQLFYSCCHHLVCVGVLSILVRLCILYSAIYRQRLSFIVQYRTAINAPRTQIPICCGSKCSQQYAMHSYLNQINNSSMNVRVVNHTRILWILLETKCTRSLHNSFRHFSLESPTHHENSWCHVRIGLLQESLRATENGF